MDYERVHRWRYVPSHNFFQCVPDGPGQCPGCWKAIDESVLVLFFGGDAPVQEPLLSEALDFLSDRA